MKENIFFSFSILTNSKILKNDIFVVKKKEKEQEENK